MSTARQHDVEPRAQARFEVVESNRGRIRQGTIRCLINHHIAIDAEALSSYCFKTLSPRIDDLVLITASVAFADRTLVRHPAQTWRRSIELTIPVNELHYWQQPPVQAALTDLLQLLTGDLWTLNFRQRQVRTATRKQPPLALSLSSKPIVMPFSDGLDSLAGARLIAAVEPQATLILVTAGRRNDADQQWRVRHLNAHRYRLVLPFKFQKSQSGHRLREMSYRSRALIYGTMVAQVVAKFGHIDVLVNCAGISDHRSFEKSDTAFFHAIFDTNVLGTVEMIQAVLPHMTTPGGRIINFSSGLATRPIPTTSIYAASKAAVAALSHALAKEFGPRGITVNTIAPGVIETEMTTTILAERGANIVAMTPLGRIGQADDIAGIAVFLASPDGKWLTGRTLIADGGIS